MKNGIKQLLFCVVFALLSSIIVGQNTGEIVHVEDGNLTIKIDKRDQENYQNLLLYFNLKEDSLFNFGNIGELAQDGWKLIKLTKKSAIIAKKIEQQHEFDWGQPLVFDQNFDIDGNPGYPGFVLYGINQFKKQPTIFKNEKEVAVFVLKKYDDATTVYLSGSFNNWSTVANAMQKTDSGWVTHLSLKPGKYLYKFIVDGNWIVDPNNINNEDDGYGNVNSAYYHYNYALTLSDKKKYKKVFLAGSFNAWNAEEIPLHKIDSNWRVDLYLNEGTHRYKFIADGEWILDPTNNQIQSDGNGNFNSTISFGNPFLFTLDGYLDAKLVMLTGNFNQWNVSELIMQKTTTGWQLPYVLPSGNFEYKFIVDGIWTLDTKNPLQIGPADAQNSVIVINPNYTFTLKTDHAVKKVSVSGTFNNWSDQGYQMTKVDGKWQLPLYLTNGKYQYKFIVDGNWITDPANPLIDENEFQTGNSVLWIEPALEFIEK